MLQAAIDLRQGDFHLDVRFEVPDEITALFGPSGSGKSTLLAALAGLRPGAAHVRLQGKAVDPRPHRRGIGLVFQDALLFPHRNVRGNLDYAWRRADPLRRRDIAEVAAFFDIEGLLDRSVGTLSGGERARVALARAVVAAPRLLLLDEPFAALDGARRRKFIAILADMHRAFALPMIVVTHLIDDSVGLASHLIGLREGRIVAEGPLVEVGLSAAFRSLLDPRDIGAALTMRTGDGRTAPTWLRADNVLLAGRRPEALSARNVLEGRVVSVIAEHDGSRLIELETATARLLARVTPEAVAELGLTRGGTAWAVVKAHAL
jgi:molybdate transport system ATP-binding protein